MHLDVFDPVFNAFKSLSPCTVVHNYDPLCAPVIRACYGLESLLTRSVPNLQLVVVVINVDSLVLVIDSYSCDKVVVVSLARKSHNEARFADFRVANDDHFKSAQRVIIHFLMI